MHIEEHVVQGAKLALGYLTAAGSLAVAARVAVETVRNDGLIALAGRSALATAAVFTFFEVLPHHPVGVSEVHLILGSTLFLLLGAGPAAIGLALGLLIQGLFFAPFDLPQYGMNVTTLLVPLFAVAAIARRVIPRHTAYTDVTYGQALKLSLTYQGGVATWVAFWALFGQGFGAENLMAVGTFFAAYMTVILVEPLVDLAVLAGAKSLRAITSNGLFNPRLHQVG